MNSNLHFDYDDVNDLQRRYDFSLKNNKSYLLLGNSSCCFYCYV